MAFAITPATSDATAAPEQVDVAVIDFITDPEVCTVTRGVGENSHVITVKRPEASVVAKSPGWMTDILDSGSTPLHANDGYGTYQDFIASPGVTIQHETYAGIEDYAGETIVWVPTWTPTVADPSPTITPLSGGRVEVYWDTVGGGWPKTSQGLLTLAVTVNGSPSAQTIEFVSGVGGDYTQMAWGPTP